MIQLLSLICQFCFWNFMNDKLIPIWALLFHSFYSFTYFTTRTNLMCQIADELPNVWRLQPAPSSCSSGRTYLELLHSHDITGQFWGPRNQISFQLDIFCLSVWFSIRLAGDENFSKNTIFRDWLAPVAMLLFCNSEASLWIHTDNLLSLRSVCLLCLHCIVGR
jgi:hypothetical protein